MYQGTVSGRLSLVTTTISRPASPAQIKFIGDLLAQIPAEATGVTDIPALLANLSTNPTFDTRKASAFIDTLKTLKANAPAVAAVQVPGMPADAKPNRYPGKCQDCKGQVPGGAGYFVRSSTGKVVVYHLPGQCTPPAAPLAAPEHGLYIDQAEGKVWKVYTGRQSGRLQAAILVVHDDHGSFEYQQGGTRIVAEALAAGTMRLLTQDEAAVYGRTYGWCVNCGLVIEDDRSLAAGYGPVCAENNGWWYPTYEEAAQVLRRPVTKPSGVVVNPTCTACGGDYIADEACLAGSPDYKGEYPTHTV
jgi:hypothetical protein